MPQRALPLSKCAKNSFSAYRSSPAIHLRQNSIEGGITSIAPVPERIRLQTRRNRPLHTGLAALTDLGLPRSIILPSLMTATLSQFFNTEGRRCATVTTVAARNAFIMVASTISAVVSSICTDSRETPHAMGGHDKRNQAQTGFGWLAHRICQVIDATVEHDKPFD